MVDALLDSLNSFEIYSLSLSLSFDMCDDWNNFEKFCRHPRAQTHSHVYMMYTHTCSNTHKKIKIILQSNYIPGHKRTRMYDVHNNTSSKSTVYIPEHKRTRMYTCILRIYMHTHAQTIIEIKKNGSFEPPLGAVVSLHERDPETLERFESSASIVK